MSGQVLQSGRVTPGHGVSWTTDGVVQDAGYQLPLNFSAPPPIGDVTPNTGNFTNLAASGTIAQGPGVFDVTANNVDSPAEFNYSFVYAQNAGGAGNPVTGGQSTVNGMVISDSVCMISGASLTGYTVTMTMAPNGNTASGSRAALSVLMNQIGTKQGGTITSPGISSGAVINSWGQSNCGGTATLYQGALNGLNSVARLTGTATYMRGASSFEADSSAVAGSSYISINQCILAYLNEHAVHGYTNSNTGLVFTAQVGALNDLIYGIKFNDPDAATPLDPWSRLLYASPAQDTYTTTVAAAIDFGNLVTKTFAARFPYWQEVPLQANAISGVTRLTSDGAAANSFAYEVVMDNLGASYETNPTYTVSGSGGAVIQGPTASNTVGVGTILAHAGVYTPGTTVLPEATCTISGGGGMGGACHLVMAGNTLNFPINSAIDVVVKLVFTSTAGDAICWSIEFGAYMGATASTTAIAGSPSWTQVWETSGASSSIGISAPTADTTLGAINLTVTPTSGTWSGGGKATIVKSTRV